MNLSQKSIKVIREMEELGYIVSHGDEDFNAGVIIQCKKMFKFNKEEFSIDTIFHVQNNLQRYFLFLLDHRVRMIPIYTEESPSEISSFVSDNLVYFWVVWSSMRRQGVILEFNNKLLKFPLHFCVGNYIPIERCTKRVIDTDLTKLSPDEAIYTALIEQK